MNFISTLFFETWLLVDHKSHSLSHAISTRSICSSVWNPFISFSFTSPCVPNTLVFVAIALYRYTFLKLWSKINLCAFQPFSNGIYRFLNESFLKFMMANIFTLHFSKIWNKEIGVTYGDELYLLIELLCKTLNKGEMIVSIKNSIFIVDILFWYQHHTANVLLLKEINQPISGYEKIIQQKFSPS